ncbi:MAG TPA: SUF system Fe-S cluster assembly protein [Telmatospirillum sp.]|nr:SUF system Fe-S cluster assembly protein [Telmatospirillum sp.]
MMNPSASSGEDSVARAGQPLDAGERPATEDEIVEALRQVYDPEIPVNIYDLGLIYKIDIDNDASVAIAMTLTSPGCPVAGSLPQRVADVAASVPGVGEVDVSLVWDPPWTMDTMSPDAKLALNL